MEGISFLVRIRDEEDTLKESIESLFALNVPHEIILILHLCKDRSLEIANELQTGNPNVKILTYDHEVSRAGYEHLATDAKSKHSLVTYYNWCLKKAKYPWVFKWDADFVSTPALIDYLNAGKWVKEAKIIQFNAYCDGIDHKEFYLISGLLSYVKYTFCEVIFYTYGSEKVITNIKINHISKPSTIKSYWNLEPWFKLEDSEEARIVSERVRRLTEEFGEEPRGLFRYGNNKNYVNITSKIINAKVKYVNYTS
jgi:hypothetical protein